jgi:hypothetical protein
VNIAMIVLFVALQVADCWQTCYGLGRGLAESNPVVVLLFGRHPAPAAIIGTSVLAIATILIVSVLLPFPWYVWLAINGLRVWAVVENHMAIKETK